MDGQETTSCWASRVAMIKALREACQEGLQSARPPGVQAVNRHMQPLDRLADTLSRWSSSTDMLSVCAVSKNVLTCVEPLID
jgi:hypothetical protein